MFNVSAFDQPDLGDGADHAIEGTDSHQLWEVLTGVLVPLLVLVVVVCLLVRQNLELARRLIDSINQLLGQLGNCLRRWRATTADVGGDEGGPELPSAGVPRNLTDEEVIQMRSVPEGTRWV